MKIVFRYGWYLLIPLTAKNSYLQQRVMCPPLKIHFQRVIERVVLLSASANVVLEAAMSILSPH
jgi:hypothetical protein